MKGTILDFLKLATEKEALAKELLELATKYDFEFTSDELSDADLDSVAGGVGLASSRLPVSLQTPSTSTAALLTSFSGILPGFGGTASTAGIDTSGPMLGNTDTGPLTDSSGGGA